MARRDGSEIFTAVVVAVTLVAAVGLVSGLFGGWVVAVWLVAFVVCGIASLALLAFWHAGDPPGERRRCPSCWYDLGERAVPLVCPECGVTIKSEDATKQRRRRRGLLVASVGVMGLYVVSLVADEWRSGRFADRWPLVMVLPALPYGHDDLWDRARQRIDSPWVSLGQRERQLLASAMLNALNPGASSSARGFGTSAMLRSKLDPQDEDRILKELLAHGSTPERLQAASATRYFSSPRREGFNSMIRDWVIQDAAVAPELRQLILESLARD